MPCTATCALGATFRSERLGVGAVGSTRFGSLDACLAQRRPAAVVLSSQYQTNQQRLLENAQSHGGDRRRSPPGEGPALLQGLVVCGVCGRRMTLRYHQRDGRLTPTYVCQREGIEHSRPICQSIPGHVVDEALSRLVLDAMQPVTLEVALAVQQALGGSRSPASATR